MSTGRKVWSIISPVLIYFLITVVVATVIEFAAMAVNNYAIYDLDAVTEMLPGLMLIITFVTYIVSLIVFFLIFRKERMMQGGAEAVLTPKGVIITVAVCLAVSLVLQFLFAVSQIDKIFPTYDVLVQTTFAGQPVWLLALSVGVVGPIGEELLFRGIIFTRLERYLGTKPAIIISALIFGAVHLNMVQFIYASAVGILFAYFYSKYRNIRIPILAHIAVNMAGVVLMALGY